MESPLIVRRFDTYSRFFVSIDRRFHAPSEVTFEGLVEAFGKEMLRRNHVPVSFIVQALQMESSEKAAEDATERRRIRQIMMRFENMSWNKDLVEYEAFLRKKEENRRVLSEKTIRSYLCAAGTLLCASGKGSVRELDNEVVRRVLRKKKGLAASLMPFCRYLRKIIGIDLAISPSGGKSSGRKQKALLDKVRRSIKVLRVTKNASEARAHMAILIAHLIGLPLREVLRLEKGNIVVGKNHLRIRARPEEKETEIAEPACFLMNKWLVQMVESSSGNPFLFEGNSNHRAMDVSSVDYWAKKN